MSTFLPRHRPRKKQQVPYFNMARRSSLFGPAGQWSFGQEHGTNICQTCTAGFGLSLNFRGFTTHIRRPKVSIFILFSTSKHNSLAKWNIQWVAFQASVRSSLKYRWIALRQESSNIPSSSNSASSSSMPFSSSVFSMSKFVPLYFQV